MICLLQKLLVSFHQQFQRRRAALPLSPSQLRDLAQKLLRLLAALEPGLSLEGGVVTAVFRFPPVRLLYFFTPCAVIPAPDSVDLLSPDFWDIPFMSSFTERSIQAMIGRMQNQNPNRIRPLPHHRKAAPSNRGEFQQRPAPQNLSNFVKGDKSTGERALHYPVAGPRGRRRHRR